MSNVASSGVDSTCCFVCGVRFNDYEALELHVVTCLEEANTMESRNPRINTANSITNNNGVSNSQSSWGMGNPLQDDISSEGVSRASAASSASIPLSSTAENTSRRTVDSMIAPDSCVSSKGRQSLNVSSYYSPSDAAPELIASTVTFSPSVTPRDTSLSAPSMGLEPFRRGPVSDSSSRLLQQHDGRLNLDESTSSSLRSGGTSHSRRSRRLRGGMDECAERERQRRELERTMMNLEKMKTVNLEKLRFSQVVSVRDSRHGSVDADDGVRWDDRQLVASSSMMMMSARAVSEPQIGSMAPTMAFWRNKSAYCTPASPTDHHALYSARTSKRSAMERMTRSATASSIPTDSSLMQHHSSGKPKAGSPILTADADAKKTQVPESGEGSNGKLIASVALDAPATTITTTLVDNKRQKPTLSTFSSSSPSAAAGGSSTSAMSTARLSREPSVGLASSRIEDSKPTPPRVAISEVKDSTMARTTESAVSAAAAAAAAARTRKDDSKGPSNTNTTPNALQLDSDRLARAQSPRTRPVAVLPTVLSLSPSSSTPAAPTATPVHGNEEKVREKEVQQQQKHQSTKRAASPTGKSASPTVAASTAIKTSSSAPPPPTQKVSSPSSSSPATPGNSTKAPKEVAIPTTQPTAQQQQQQLPQLPPAATDVNGSTLVKDPAAEEDSQLKKDDETEKEPHRDHRPAREGTPEQPSLQEGGGGGVGVGADAKDHTPNKSPHLKSLNSSQQLSWDSLTRPSRAASTVIPPGTSDRLSATRPRPSNPEKTKTVRISLTSPGLLSAAPPPPPVAGTAATSGDVQLNKDEDGVNPSLSNSNPSAAAAANERVSVEPKRVTTTIQSDKESVRRARSTQKARAPPSSKSTTESEPRTASKFHRSSYAASVRRTEDSLASIHQPRSTTANGKEKATAATSGNGDADAGSTVSASKSTRRKSRAENSSASESEHPSLMSSVTGKTTYAGIHETTRRAALQSVLSRIDHRSAATAKQMWRPPSQSEGKSKEGPSSPPTAVKLRNLNPSTSSPTAIVAATTPLTPGTSAPASYTRKRRETKSELLSGEKENSGKREQVPKSVRNDHRSPTPNQRRMLCRTQSIGTGRQTSTSPPQSQLQPLVRFASSMPRLQQSLERPTSEGIGNKPQVPPSGSLSRSKAVVIDGKLERGLSTNPNLAVPSTATPSQLLVPEQGKAADLPTKTVHVVEEEKEVPQRSAVDGSHVAPGKQNLSPHTGSRNSPISGGGLSSNSTTNGAPDAATAAVIVPTSTKSDATGSSTSQNDTATAAGTGGGGAGARELGQSAAPETKEDQDGAVDGEEDDGEDSSLYSPAREYANNPTPSAAPPTTTAITTSLTKRSATSFVTPTATAKPDSETRKVRTSVSTSTSMAKRAVSVKKNSPDGRRPKSVSAAAAPPAKNTPTQSVTVCHNPKTTRSRAQISGKPATESVARRMMASLIGRGSPTDSYQKASLDAEPRGDAATTATATPSPSAASPVSDDAKPIATSFALFCTECGHKFVAQEKFCGVCGHRREAV